MSWLWAQAKRVRRRGWALIDRRGRPSHPELVLTAEDERYLSSPYDDAMPLPPTAARLDSTHPELTELRRAYSRLRIAPTEQVSRWTQAAVGQFLDHRYFRGDSLIMWHYRELPRATALKYFIYASYVRGRDPRGLLDELDEDGAFGCWTFRYRGHPTYSRDLIESVNEIGFLERTLQLSMMPQLSILDIGAGYGRLAHRMRTAYPNLVDYCCVDAVPESTFLCRYYLNHRGCMPPARVVPLPEAVSTPALGRFDLVVNIHSFSECTLDAIAWWLEFVRPLKIPRLFIVPNDGEQLLSTEADGSRRDFMPLIEGAGYRLTASEPVVTDPAVRDLVKVHDYFCLFSADQ